MWIVNVPDDPRVRSEPLQNLLLDVKVVLYAGPVSDGLVLADLDGGFEEYARLNLEEGGRRAGEDGHGLSFQLLQRRGG